MSELITNFTQTSTGAIATLNGAPITESVEVDGTVSTVPTSGDVSPTLIPTTPLALLPVNSVPTNPNSRGVNDVSDIRPTSQLVYLPTRAENRIIPTDINASLIDQTFERAQQVGSTPGKPPGVQVQNTDFFTTPWTEAKRLLTDFIKIRIPHRGVNPSSMQPDPTQAVEFRFLINPATLTVNRQTVDAQSVTRGGWQFGVWGEDAFLVQMTGHSAGSYFTLGLTDEYSYYAVSYRNLMQLQQVFENNGYWFEGEEYNEGPLAANYLRRRIRMHQDVELWVGNFIWFGMFDSLTISQDADHPFMLNFQLSFYVWKERFRSTSPYWGTIPNNIERGHSYSAVEGTTGQTPTNNTLSQYAPPAVSAQTTQLSTGLSGVNTPYTNSPAVGCAVADDITGGVGINTIDADNIGPQPTLNLVNPGGSTYFWNNGLT